MHRRCSVAWRRHISPASVSATLGGEGNWPSLTSGRRRIRKKPSAWRVHRRLQAQARSGREPEWNRGRSERHRASHSLSEGGWQAAFLTWQPSGRLHMRRTRRRRSRRRRRRTCAICAETAVLGVHTAPPPKSQNRKASCVHFLRQRRRKIRASGSHFKLCLRTSVYSSFALLPAKRVTDRRTRVGNDARSLTRSLALAKV